LEKQNKLKILFWPGWWYPSRVSPLSGVFIQRHAEAVTLFCDTAVLFIVPDPGLGKKFIVESAAEKNLQVTRIYFRPAPPIPLIAKLVDMASYYRLSRIGQKAIREKFGKPDIVHIHVNPPLGLIIYALTHFRKTPCVFSEHWSGYFPESGAYKGFFRKLFTKLLINKAKAVTVVSHAAQKAMLRHGLKNNYHVIANVVDTELFAPALVKNENSKKQILHVSGFNPCKNIRGILHAVKKLAAKRDDFELHIIGDGLSRRDLETMAIGLGIKDRVVHFHGKKTAYAVAGFMRQADFFLLFSDYENSPCVIAEAFAAGIPVIATRVGGIPEHVHEDNGILVDPGDEAGLSKAIDFMLDNHKNFAADKIREYALKTFRPDVVGRLFYDIYQSVAVAATYAKNHYEKS
jgi:glycosyltransferase involved in cell wall biosynthesis